MKNKYKIIIFMAFVPIIIYSIFAFINSLNRQLAYGNNDYYDYYIDASKKDESTNKKTKAIPGKTIIDHTIKLENQNITNKSSAQQLISSVALDQEKKCSNNLLSLEDDLKTKTGISGINYCEIKEEEANKITTTIKEVYDLYPIMNNYITNITIVNDGGLDSYIAAFKPAFTFATSRESDKFPFVIKTQIYLNASYYLNEEYLTNVINNAEKTNYFPENTTKESLVAHELGHALTYILAIKQNKSINTILVTKNDFKLYSTTLNNYTSSNFSKEIVKNAYSNYLNNYSTISEEDFRQNISLYANSKNDDGSVLYNETVAEAFHDYYLHRENCKKESMEIIKVINSYI